MFKAAQEALTDRLRTPILGTFSLLFLYFNYLDIHKLLANFGDAVKTEEAFGTIYWKFLEPFLFTILYVIATSMIKIINDNLNIAVTWASDCISDFISEAQFRENIRKLNDYQTKEELLKSYVVPLESQMKQIMTFATNANSKLSKQKLTKLENENIETFKITTKQLSSIGADISNLKNRHEKVVSNIKQIKKDILGIETPEASKDDLKI